MCDERTAVKLLFVEDDEGIRVLLEAVFRPRFVAVEFACDGRIAIDRLRERTYDVVVLDLMLPAVNGAVRVRRFRLRLESRRFLASLRPDFGTSLVLPFPKPAK